MGIDVTVTLCDSMKDEIKEMYKSGLSVDEIVQQYEINMSL